MNISLQNGWTKGHVKLHEKTKGHVKGQNTPCFAGTRVFPHSGTSHPGISTPRFFDNIIWFTDLRTEFWLANPLT